MSNSTSAPDSAFSQISFAMTMVAVSSLGMMKTLFLAMVMTPEGFGQYATFFGLAIIGSILVSFGDVEGTSKYYPRLWITSQFETIRSDIASTIQKLLIRWAILIVVTSLTLALLEVFIADHLWPSLAIFLTTLFILPTSILLLLASAIRATGSSNLLIVFTGIRGGAALALVLLASAFWDWEYLLVAETLAAFATLFLFFPRFRKEVEQARANKDSSRKDAAYVKKSGGQYLYVANLVSSAVPYGGRAAINLLAGPAMAGAYAVLMIFVQMGQLLTGVITQRVGPQLIKWRMEGEHASIKTISVSLFIILAVSIIAFVILATSLYIDIAASFWRTYGIGMKELFLTCISMCLSIYLILEFMLISVDREKTILGISVIAVLICYLGFYIGNIAGLGIVGFLVSTILMDSFRIGIFTLSLNKK